MKKYLHATFEHVVVLSSPGTHDTARAKIQKWHWLCEKFGPGFNVVFKLSKEKHYYACPNSILIDDWGANIRRWSEAGGKAVKHESAEGSIQRVKALLASR